MHIIPQLILRGINKCVLCYIVLNAGLKLNNNLKLFCSNYLNISLCEWSGPLWGTMETMHNFNIVHTSPVLSGLTSRVVPSHAKAWCWGISGVNWRT